MNGTVLQATDGRLHIAIACHSACAHCETNKTCGFAESKEKEIEVECDDWRRYTAGDAVSVDIRESQGLLAVLIAYILPSVLGLAFFFATCRPWGELYSALGTIVFFGVYAAVLRLMRHRLQRRFTYHVAKAGE
ncbi:MAG: positive regulator of sigma(E), RseC/MucC [bacterium P3]|nr:MAG: positive regulator of sigma(E), RseC/MucC [bacterium P3]KWW42704.1 MAG: positive regulator of sigma(E), RseC/MucC [bacterium F083]